VKIDKSYPLTAPKTAPSVFVEVTVGAVTKTTPTITGSFEPVFDAYLFYVLASDLETSVHIKVWDFDGVGGNNLICEWTEKFSETSEIIPGAAKIFWPDSCKYVSYIEFAIY